MDESKSSPSCYKIMTTNYFTVKKEIPEAKVLGISLYASDINSATSLVLDHCQRNKRSNLCISATGAHGLVHAKRNQQFENILKHFFINLPDGMPAVWIGRLKGKKTMERCYGPSFFENLIVQSKDIPITHFLCGGNDGVAEELRNVVATKFNNHNVAGTFCPPFLDVNSYDYNSIADIINKTGANIVWIGLSTPKQEIFAANLARKTNAHFIITVGAAFDFHTGKVPQAPSILQKLGLEWFFRLMMEPNRLYKRYLEIVPLFIYYNLRELLLLQRKNN